MGGWAGLVREFPKFSEWTFPIWELELRKFPLKEIPNLDCVDIRDWRMWAQKLSISGSLIY